MNDFMDKLQKVRSGFFKQKRFLFVLDIIIVFSILYSIFIILNAGFFLEKASLNSLIPVNIIPPVLAFIVALGVSLIMHRKDAKANVTLLIEDKYPELKERLRTAYDNRGETNIIVDSLKSYVSNALDKVSSSRLFAKRKMAAKILVTVIFIFASVVITLTPSLRVPPDDVANFANTIGGTIGNVTNETITTVVGVPGESDTPGKAGAGDIFGKPEIAPVEGKPVDLSLDIGGGQGNVPKDYDPTQNQFIRSAAFPVDILGSNVSDGGYGILIKKTQSEKELINKYAVERTKI